VYIKGWWAKEIFNGEWDRTRMSGNAWSWEYQVEPKFEFGVTDFLTALTSFSCFYSEYKEYDRPVTWGSYSVKNNGIKYVTAGGRMRFVEAPIVVSGQLKGFIYPGYDTTKAPAPGKGDDSLEARGLLGKTFAIPLLYKEWRLPAYIGIESGYRWRNKNVCNDIPFFIEGGCWPFKWLLVKAEIDGYKAHRGTGSDYEDYANWRVGGAYQVFGDSTLREGTLFNIEVQYGQTFWGRNTTALQEIIFKIQTQF
jgi:hypothetical protein